MNDRDRNDLFLFFGSFSGEDYLYQLGISETLVNDALLRDITETAERTPSYFFFVHENNTPEALLFAYRSDYASTVFGLEVLKVELLCSKSNNPDHYHILVQQLLRSVRNSPVKLIWGKFPIGQLSLNNTLIGNGFSLYGTNVIFQYTKRAILRADVEAKQLREKIIRQPKKTDLADMLDIIEHKYRYGHFFSDPRISAAQAQELYKKAVAHQLERDQENMIVIEHRNGAFLGFSMIKSYGSLNRSGARNIAQWEFTGFKDSNVMAPGVITMFLKEFMNKGYDMLITEVALDNLPSMKMVMKQPGKYLQSKHIFHYWND